MWDAVRKIFRHDETPDDVKPRDEAAPVGAPLAGTDVGHSAAPSSFAETGQTVRISPPDHAPQGLADAELAAAPQEGRIDRAAPTDGSEPLMPMSDGMAMGAPAPSDVTDATSRVGSSHATNAQAEEREAEAVAPPLPLSTGVEAAPGEVVVPAPTAEPSVPEDSPPALVAPEPKAFATESESTSADRAATPDPSTTVADASGADASATSTSVGETGGAPTSADTAPARMMDSSAAAAGAVQETRDTLSDADAPAAHVQHVQTDMAVMPSMTDTAAAPSITDALVETAETAPVVSEEAGAALVTPEPETLAPGTVVAGRYTIVEPFEEAGDTRAYRAADARSYERCWSCGSARNGPGNRFCQNCGAPIQNHPVVLIQTATPTGAPGEVEHGGLYLHVRPERRPFGVEGVGLEIGAHSAEGPHHPNEDSYWYTTRTLSANSGRHSVAVAILADGMGGYAPGSGLISSRIAATAGASIAGALDARGDEALGSDEAETIARAGIAEANDMVLAEIARSGEMGATLVGAVVHGDTAYVANIGDSRAYYINPQGQATRITRDQSLVAQELGQGSLSEEDIYSAPGNNIILHAVGEERVETAADWYAQPLEPDSLLILCSDGYWKTMRGTVIPEGVARESATLTDVARRMVDDALARGSDDNTTVLLIAIS